ncbi:MAG: RIP metalloprotease RseP, partial [Stellaceae bacterium]
VKMFGDADPASMPGQHVATMTESEKAVSFHHKRLPQRAAVVAAGPIANFVFAVLVLALLFATAGQPFTPAEVGRVEAGSAAQAAGIKPGDVILAIDGEKIARFEDVQRMVRLNTGTPMQLVLKRGGSDVTVDVTPRMSDLTDRFGNHHEIALLGIERSGVDYVRRNPAAALWYAGQDTMNLTTGTLQAVYQMVLGLRPADEIGGPIRIAQMSGEVAQGGLVPLLYFMAMLSVNLGLINLFPIPVLDGGHLLFYAAEAVRGRPLGQRAQEYGFRLGLALVLTLMVFATWNDLVHLRVVQFIKGLIT